MKKKVHFEEKNASSPLPRDKWFCWLILPDRFISAFTCSQRVTDIFTISQRTCEVLQNLLRYPTFMVMSRFSREQNLSRDTHDKNQELAKTP